MKRVTVAICNWLIILTSPVWILIAFASWVYQDIREGKNALSGRTRIW